MRPFTCDCGQPLFFDNTRCLGCGSEVAYAPARRHLGPIDRANGGTWTFRDDDGKALVRLCAHRMAAAACNWTVPATEPHAICLSCRTTRTIPDVSVARNAERLRDVESAKRRVLFNLQVLGLPVVPR